MNSRRAAAFLSIATLSSAAASPAKAEMSTPNRADAAFAAALYHQLATTKGNLLFSPFSIRTALGMACAGAAGNTASQIKTVLGFPADASNIDQQLGDTAKRLNQPQNNYTLAVADALWGEMTYPFNPAFGKGLVQNFDANFHTTDFAAAPESARAAINKWVGKHTANKITDLFPPGSIDRGTALVLANAVYFKAKWEQPFSAHATRPSPFHLDAAHDVKTPTMNATLHGAAYFETADAQIVDLPYQGKALSMTLVVPKNVEGLSKVESQLDAASIQKWTSSMKPATVELSLPKLKLNASFTLSSVLSAMGMPDAFDRHAANFTGMIDPGAPSPGPLFIGQVFHRAMADVNEQGTEAAAATGMGMVAAGLMRPPSDLVTVDADRPFMLLIRERDSGAILFMGRVSNPR